MSPKQQRRPLPSLLSLCYFYASFLCSGEGDCFTLPKPVCYVGGRPGVLQPDCGGPAGPHSVVLLGLCRQVRHFSCIQIVAIFRANALIEGKIMCLPPTPIPSCRDSKFSCGGDSHVGTCTLYSILHAVRSVESSFQLCLAALGAPPVMASWHGVGLGHPP